MARRVSSSPSTAPMSSTSPQASAPPAPDRRCSSSWRAGPRTKRAESLRAAASRARGGRADGTLLRVSTILFGGPFPGPVPPNVCDGAQTP
ncbi:exported hypothetical protein [Nostocoides australiense Ben110]|uniref:Uncharacterized protein n=1 Tax=Nostocoides australiense Ben110 TaxID=1193182 RepID=W6JYE4_9MICO|nr:exported hypothetical protein [Tetrasphaera australiensis Ben110]